jgi:hypothetical protein
MRASTFALLAFAVPLAACGGNIDFTIADASTDGPADALPDGSDDTATDTAIDTAPPDGCPASLPSSGAACSKDGLVCGYGDDPRPQCRPTATCSNGSWSVGKGVCPPSPTATCPASAVAAAGQACSPDGAFCTYGNVICGCSACGAGPCGLDATWHCDAPPADPRCPRAVPNLGRACSNDGLSCTYGSCGAGDIAGRKCENGVWIDQPSACPV